MTNNLSGPLKLHSKFHDFTIKLADGETRRVHLAVVASSSGEIDGEFDSATFQNIDFTEYDLSCYESAAVNTCIDIMYEIPKTFGSFDEWEPVVTVARTLGMRELDVILDAYSPTQDELSRLIELAAARHAYGKGLCKKILSLDTKIDALKIAISKINNISVLSISYWLDNVADSMVPLINFRKRYLIAAITTIDSAEYCEKLLTRLDVKKCTRDEFDLLLDPAVKLSNTVRYLLKAFQPATPDESTNGNSGTPLKPVRNIFHDD